MKKYISLLLATAATIACTKVAPEDNSPIESLPQDGNTENVQGEPSGEKIIISLAETKVSLDGDGCYQFDGDEVIYVQASSTKAVAKLQNSAAKPTTFTGVFNGLLGETSETFDFYYNCTDENANVVTDENGNVVVVKVQNGQPWLAATGVPGKRSTSSEYSYELSDVKLNQLGGYVCLALNSGYPCTVDFHTLTTALPNGETTITGIQFGSGNNKPYFVNIKSGMTGGFYLTVTNPKGQKMYTSYGTTAKISSNQIIKTKETFEAFTGVSNLEITGFETTYSYYDANNPTKANNKTSNWMNGGSISFNLSGISSSLVNLTFNNGDADETGTLTKDGSLYTYNFKETNNHDTVGEKMLKASINFKGGIEPTATTEITVSRYITGLPYDIQPTASEWNKTSLYVSFKSGYVYMEGDWSTTPDITSKKNFYIPSDININCNFNYVITSAHKYAKDRKSTIKMYISGGKVLDYTLEKMTTDTKNANVNGTLKASNNKLKFEAKSNATRTEGIGIQIPVIPVRYGSKN